MALFMDAPIFTSLAEIVWTLVAYWLVWFCSGFVVSLWIIWRCVRPTPRPKVDGEAPVVDRRGGWVSNEARSEDT